jgi:hypothetical protein
VALASGVSELDLIFLSMRDKLFAALVGTDFASGTFAALVSESLSMRPRKGGPCPATMKARFLFTSYPASVSTSTRELLTKAERERQKKRNESGIEHFIGCSCSCCYAIYYSSVVPQFWVLICRIFSKLLLLLLFFMQRSSAAANRERLVLSATLTSTSHRSSRTAGRD